MLISPFLGDPSTFSLRYCRISLPATTLRLRIEIEIVRVTTEIIDG